MSSASHPHYRPDIDGLRAVAVFIVVLFHAFPQTLPGGFVGVDVFFVISGYLISRILLQGLERDRFTLIGFYARRVRRIFPALLVVLAASLVLGWRLLDPDAMAQLGRHILAGAGFVANLVFWSEVGYFDTDADLKPLLHLWSLGVEEQFYIFWPILLWACWKQRLSVFKTVAIVTGLSFVLSVVLTVTHPSAAFYMPLSRAWELGAGSLIAIAHGGRARLGFVSGLSKVGGVQLSAVGLALIIGASLILDKSSPFPGWLALLPVCGTCLVLLSAESAFVNARLLASRPAVWIGLISYPLYLWHWVLLSFLRIETGAEAAVGMRIFMVLLSLALAAVTYLLIERPIRATAIRGWKVPALAASMVCLAVIGAIAASSGGFASRFALRSSEMKLYAYDWKSDARIGECMVEKMDPPDAYAASCLPIPAPDKQTVMIWGDSHAGRFAPGFTVAQTNFASVGSMTRSSCPPIISHIYEECRAANLYVLDRIEESKPDIVVLFGFWMFYAYDTKWPLDADETKAESALRDALLEVTDRLAAAGTKRIIVVGPYLRWDAGLPKILTRNARADGRVPERLDSAFDKRVFRLDRLLESVTWNASVEYFSVTRALCDPRGCLTYVEDAGQYYPLTWDYGHLTTPGGAAIARMMSLGAVKRAAAE